MNRIATTKPFPISSRPDVFEVRDPRTMTTDQVASHRALLNLTSFCQALAALVDAAPTISDVCHDRLNVPPLASPPLEVPPHLMGRDLG